MCTGVLVNYERMFRGRVATALPSASMHITSWSAARCIHTTHSQGRALDPALFAQSVSV